MAESFLADNLASRERLRELVARLSDEQLATPLDGGWTIGAMLAHLAFWDQRALLLLERWQQGQAGPSPVDEEIMNGATFPLCLAVPPRTAANLALNTAQAIDEAIEQLGQEAVEQMRQAGYALKLDRAEHRLEHIDQIERALNLKA